MSDRVALPAARLLAAPPPIQPEPFGGRSRLPARRVDNNTEGAARRPRPDTEQWPTNRLGPDNGSANSSFVVEWRPLSTGRGAVYFGVPSTPYLAQALSQNGSAGRSEDDPQFHADAARAYRAAVARGATILGPDFPLQVSA